jgi:putative transposase
MVGGWNRSSEETLVIRAERIIRTDKEPLSDILRDFKKFTAKEIVKILTLDQINESRKEWLLRAFKKSGESLKRIKNYKVWQDGNHPELLISNKLLIRS